MKKKIVRKYGEIKPKAQNKCRTPSSLSTLKDEKPMVCITYTYTRSS